MANGQPQGNDHGERPAYVRGDTSGAGGASGPKACKKMRCDRPHKCERCGSSAHARLDALRGVPRVGPQALGFGNPKKG